MPLLYNVEYKQLRFCFIVDLRMCKSELCYTFEEKFEVVIRTAEYTIAFLKKKLFLYFFFFFPVVCFVQLSIIFCLFSFVFYFLLRFIYFLIVLFYLFFNCFVRLSFRLFQIELWFVKSLNERLVIVSNIRIRIQNQKDFIMKTQMNFKNTNENACNLVCKYVKLNDFSEMPKFSIQVYWRKSSLNDCNEYIYISIYV